MKFTPSEPQRERGSNQILVVLRRGNPLSMNEMARRIEENCTLTKADVVGMLSAPREMAAEEQREKGLRRQGRTDDGWP